MGDVILTVPRTSVEPYYDQPRTEFDDARLEELAESLRELGQQDPVLVRELSPGRYQLIDGERRWRALELIGAKSIDVRVRAVADESEQFLRSVVANVARADMTPSEIARAVARLSSMPRFRACQSKGALHTSLAKFFGRSQAWIERMLAISTLPDDVQQLVDEKDLTLDMAVELAAVPSAEQKRALAERIAGARMHASDARQLVRSAAQLEGVPNPRRNRPPAFRGPRPTSQAKLVSQLLTRIEQTAELVLDMPARGLDKVYADRPEAAAKAVERLGAAIQSLQQLREALGRIGGTA